MKHSNLQAFLCACFLFACASATSAQSEIGIRALFFQNDFSRIKSAAGQVSPESHAGEWQNGISFRHFHSNHFASHLELNFTRGRYRFAGQGDYYWLNSQRFAYLNFCALPEWRVSETVFLGAGGFLNLRLKDPFETQKPLETGALVNLGLRHGPFEIVCRFQHWFGPSRKFAFGAGLDYFFELNKKAQQEGSKT